jgi:transcriptional regulator with XRE-family HTH domain
MTTTIVRPSRPLSLEEEVRRRIAVRLPSKQARRHVRTTARVSLRRLGAEIGVTHGSIYYYECGGDPLPETAALYLATLQKLADLIGYDMWAEAPRAAPEK